MKILLAAFFSGLVFAVGLVVGGMTQASKVHDFLNVTGAWDPSLAFVMGGAIVVHFVALKWLFRRPGPLFAPRYVLPTRADVDWKLLVGSAIFGVGWGLGAVCPGPGLTLLPSGLQPAFIFVASMALAMAVFDRSQRYLQRRMPAKAVDVAATPRDPRPPMPVARP